MKGFLEEVAAELYDRCGEELGEYEVLFPSRRARLFFVDALSQIAQRPMWQPHWRTIDELMSEISGLRLGDRLRLITELYKIYSEYHDEPFDKFYFWGEMLLADFDTIDKYLIDADMLFRNLEQIKEIEADISYLTPAQIQILSFWRTFGVESDLSQEKRRFLAIWRTLLPLYHRFRARLTELGIAYNGMMQRAAADRIREGGFVFAEPRRFVVAGFNALSACEKRLFKFLATTTEAAFYWDYDDYYKNQTEQEAGMFVRQNVVEFPPCTELSHDNLRRDKALTAVAAASNAVQCKYVATVLRELVASGEVLDKQTAIVLTDENLLLPLLYSLPPEVGRVNVTMGYPLRQSLAYTFVERLVELQHHHRTKGADCTFYHADVTGLLSHPYIAGGGERLLRELVETLVAERRIAVEGAWLRRTPLLERIFRPAETWEALSDYLLEALSAVAHNASEGEDLRERHEYLSVISEEISKLCNSLEGCDIEISTETYASLLRRHLQTLRIPFEGEPLEGIQVMGILETRNLDFKNVIILSMTDDNFPGNQAAQSSFVPYNLRAAYTLPTPEHHEGVYAYYFYRLMQRAERVWMLYCSHADDKSTGEPSRYIRQLDYESGFPLRKVEVGVDVNLAENKPIVVAKDAAVMQRLARFTDAEHPARLSPTAFFRYVACPLRFYFHSVARLEADDEISEEVDAPMFGTILHAAVQHLYARIVGEASPGDTLRALIRSGEVAKAVEAAINENYLRDAKATPEMYSGNLLLVKDIVVRYLCGGVMPYDALHGDFSVVGLEEPVAYEFPFRCGERDLLLKFGGIADRIDRLNDGALRVVDYKTGAAHLDFDGIESLFLGEGKQRQSNTLQTLLYAMMLHHTRDCDVEPALYYVRNMNRGDYSPQLQDKELSICGGRYTHYAAPFEELVRATLAELYNPEMPFVQCVDVETCKYCDFQLICKRV